ncbi:hypothetical protein F183_A35970 [Bryobacterales bacterium F-183]|nr:hypothetical protein F183_A35970 [Bryobacterales bacterium F-183]
MSVAQLAEIRALQFQDLPQANRLMAEFFRRRVPFPVRDVSIRVLAVSLNSVNGILSLEDGQRLFFKAHIESQVADREYYNTQVLADAGYPVLRPVMKAKESEEQHVMLYEVVETPTMFDACRAVEAGEADNTQDLIAAQRRSDITLFSLYERSLCWQTAAENASSPVFQLFYHRLTGGRYDQFYSGQQFPYLEMPWERLIDLPWVINGREYDKPIRTLLSDAIRLLNPAQEGPVVAGHGDAHNGNVFYRGPKQDLLYFDPAFAGYHHPLIDLTKPLYHNTLAQWMYFPAETGAKLQLDARVVNGKVVVEHDYALNPLRKGILDSKAELVLNPVRELLSAKGWLRDDHREYLRAAVFCCPLLTMNLCDRAKFPANVSVLGLAHAVMTGNKDLC